MEPSEMRNETNGGIVLSRQRAREGGRGIWRERERETKNKPNEDIDNDDKDMI